MGGAAVRFGIVRRGNVEPIEIGGSSCGGVQPRQQPCGFGEYGVGDETAVKPGLSAIGLGDLGAFQPGHVVVDHAVAVAVGGLHPPEFGAVGPDDQGRRRLPPGAEGRLDGRRHDPAVDQSQVAVGEDGRRRQQQFDRRRPQISRRHQIVAVRPNLAPFAGGRQVKGAASIQGRLQLTTQSGLNDGPGEQITRRRRDHQAGHHGAAGGFPEYGDVVGVAAEGGDIGLYPLQGGDDVHDAIVARRLIGRPFGRQGGVIKEAQPSQAIVERDHHHALTRQVRPVIERGRARAVHQSAAMDPHHHRRRLSRIKRAPDVQVQAVFAHRQRADAGIALRCGLDTDRPIGRGVPTAFPPRGRPRRPPPHLCDRRGGVGNVLEGGDVAVRHARQLALVDPDQRRIVGGPVCGLSDHQGEGGQGAGDCHALSLANSLDGPMTIRK